VGPPARPADHQHPRFPREPFGVFVVDIILSMVHIVIGLWGVMAADNHYSVLISRAAAASCSCCSGSRG
jgi:hypothetical protein